MAVYNNAQASQQSASYIQTYMFWLRAYLQAQLVHKGRVFLNFAEHNYNNVRFNLFAHQGRGKLLEH